MNYKRILISETEKRRIKHIHNVSRRNEFRGLLKEEGEYNPGVDPKVAEWFKNTISKELPGFPTDGYAYSIEDPANPGTMTTVWEVLNPDNNLKYYLFTDGRAQNAKGVMSTNKWHTDPAPTFDQTSQEGTSSQESDKNSLQQNQIQQNKEAEAQQAQDQGLRRGQYIRQARKKTKMEQKDFKNLTNKCTKYKNKYTKLFNSTARNENRRNWDKNQAKKVLQDIRNECCTVVEDRFGQVLGNPLGTDNVSNAYCNTENTTTQQNTTT